MDHTLFVKWFFCWKVEKNLGHCPVVDNNEDTKNFALCRDQQKIVCAMYCCFCTQERSCCLCTLNKAWNFVLKMNTKTFNPHWYELWKQEKCSTFFHNFLIKIQLTKSDQKKYKEIKVSTIMPIRFNFKNELWKQEKCSTFFHNFLIKIQLTKSDQKKYKDIKVSTLMPIRVNFKNLFDFT